MQTKLLVTVKHLNSFAVVVQVLSLGNAKSFLPAAALQQSR